MRHRVLQPGAIHEKQIEPAVIVVVKHSHAGTHGFGKILLTGTAGFVLESDAGLCGHIFKDLLRRRPREWNAKRSRDGNCSKQTEKRTAIDLRRQAIVALREPEEVFGGSGPHIFLQGPRFLSARIPE